MCGIIGYTGSLNASDVILEGLSELEYRGYDSAGLACCTTNGIVTIKEVGKVSHLKEAIPSGLLSSCGIGHTRWATHGGVTRENAHPHSCGKVTLIHNGIIENYLTLQSELAALGRLPVSETDTEIVAILLDYLYQGDAFSAIRDTVSRLKGAYSFCILFSDQPGVIYSIRKGSPLVACNAEAGSMIASDMVALLRYSKEYFVLPENSVAKLTEHSITVCDLQGNRIFPDILSVSWDITSAQKGGYKHFMQKEIHEQPSTLQRTLLPRISCFDSSLKKLSPLESKDNNYYLPDFSVDEVPDSLIEGIHRIIIAACGTAMHAGMVGRILLERYSRIPVTVTLASEFRYEDPILTPDTLVIVISQSGETADTLAALRLARVKHIRTLAIVNVRGSSIARESDYCLYTHSGPEIAVASTKAYTAQLAVLYLFAFRFAYVSGKLSPESCSAKMRMLLTVPDQVSVFLSDRDCFKNASRALVNAEDVFFIGRNIDYALSCEGSIKLKEISYIHSEAYAAGELKHGTLSLVTDGVPVIAIATQHDVLSKMISNIKEVRARGALVVCITYSDAEIEPSLYDFRINLPASDDLFAPFCTAVCLQMIAYYTSSYRGLDVDQPRNLAKSVTVE